jgi:hypothetical protein
MRHRLTAIIAVSLTALALAGAALAHDCIRVSASLNGLQHSAGSGQWLLFDLSSAAGVKQTFADVFEAQLTDAQASCMATEYAKAKLPLSFALGLGVAGHNGELAHNNKNTDVLSNNKGIDHFEDSPIVPAVFAAGDTCGVEIPE